MKRGASVGMFYLYTMLIITALLILCSCATSHSGCNYAKAKAYNDKQMRKAKRHRISCVNNDIKGGAQAPLFYYHQLTLAHTLTLTQQSLS